jgi:hypothetical protein
MEVKFVQHPFTSVVTSYTSAWIPLVQLITEVTSNTSVVLAAVNVYQELFSILPQKTVFTLAGVSLVYVAAVLEENDPGPCVKIAGA